MKNKQITIKNKLVNHLIVCGKKSIGEKIVLKSLKTLQKSSYKQSKDLVKLAIIFSTPTFKLNKISQKKRKKKKNQKVKEVPAFISLEATRISAAIKLILTSTKKAKTEKLPSKLRKELLLSSQCKGEAVKSKMDIQKQVLSNKRLFSYFKWR
jgi:ribosomal protein S7